MKKEQLTEKLEKAFEENLEYIPKFEIVDINECDLFPEYVTVGIRWENWIIEYREIKVMADLFNDSPWIEKISDYIRIVISVNKAQF